MRTKSEYNDVLADLSAMQAWVQQGWDREDLSEVDLKIIILLDLVADLLHSLDEDNQFKD